MSPNRADPNLNRDTPNRRPVGVLAAILALVIVVAGARAAQSYAESLASQYLRTVAPDDLLLKELTLTFQRAALADSKVLPVYGSSELYWAGDPHRAPAFFQTAPTGFSVFGVGHAGAGDLFFLQTFAALGIELQGKRLVIEDSANWYADPGAIPPDQYAGNFSPEIANAFVFDAPISMDVREGGARRMLDYPDTLKSDDLLRAAIEALADPSFPHLLAYDLLVPAGQLSSWALQVQDTAQTLIYLRTSHRPPSPPVQPRSINWPAELQAATRSAQAASTNNPFGVADDGMPALRGNLSSTQVYQATVLACFDLTNRDGNAYPFPTDWANNLRSSKAWTDLALELRALQELGARPMVLSLPWDGPYYDHTPISPSARQLFYDQYRAVTSAGGVTTLDLSAQDEDPYFLHDPIAHLSARGWILFDRAFDVFWHQGSVEPAAAALADLARTAPSPPLPNPPAGCTSANAPVPTSQSSDADKLLRPPWGNGRGPAVLVSRDVVLSDISTGPAVLRPGASIPVTMQATALTDLTQHYMLDARLVDLNGAIKSEVTVPDGPTDQPPSMKWGVPVNTVLNLPVPPDLPRGLYRIQLTAFRIPTWEALPLTKTDGSAVSSFPTATVLIAPADYQPTVDLSGFAANSRPASYDFGGELQLVGTTSLAVNGRQLSFDLFWRAARQLDVDYTVFVQVLDRNGRVAAQLDSYPWGGRYPTSAWQPGQIVRDTYELSLPSATVGPYQVIVGTYRLATMQRLPVLDPTGGIQADHVSLGTVALP